MAAEMSLISGLNPSFKLPTNKPFSFPFQPKEALISRNKKRKQDFTISANLGGGDGELKKGGKKKFITKDEEPQQYWQTAGEREGENPMKTPLPYIIIFGMSTPFVILAIAFANGWIKVPLR
ncbi:protein translocase subunit SecA [Striga asiatica]|uniref:Protein translocase subunit SecA n=1 Tax=Striga asiatica TaxID=4170 RepID=A0A5A7QTB3_STRAF|nr:protein translocase subunit SecA [Striga asiatica]